MKPRPTIYDVAHAAGVSTATVSRVLNSPDKVRPSNRDKVLAAVRELGFFPRGDAIYRSRRDYMRIGVLSPFMVAASFVQRIRGITAYLSSLDYEAIIYTVQDLAQLGSYVSLLAYERRVDAVIVLSIGLEQQHVEALAQAGIPVVSVESRNGNCCHVHVDNRNGGELAAEYLLGRGLTQLGMVCSESSALFSANRPRERLAGFRDRMKAANLQLSESNVLYVPQETDNAVTACVQFLEERQDLEAVFAMSDIDAAAVLLAAKRTGRRVPDDLSVMGFDNIDLAKYLGLTTIDQFLDESGRLAAEMATKRLRDPDLPKHTVELSLSVVERDTVR